ncbi:MAG: ferredoxin [Candidatus Daviesbacteria bacterium]|nr:ferredoxin [Candidatus Daviesbacteria bacterium]
MDPSQDKEVTIGKYKVKVIRSLCISAAACVGVSPATFTLDEEKKAVITEGSTDTPENILLAAQACPTQAIVVIDTESGKQIWPV